MKKFLSVLAIIAVLIPSVVMAQFTVFQGGTGVTTIPAGLIRGNGTADISTITTSAGVFGLLSDEIGTGSLVGSILPTFAGLLTGNGATGAGFLRWLEDTDNGSNYLEFISPSAITSNQQCVFENDASFIPDSCVGDGTDDGGGVPTTITVANEATDTTSFIGFFTAATGDLGPKTNTNLAFNSNTGVLNFGVAPTIAGAADYYVGGTDVALADGGVGSSLSDPDEDRLMFWDDSAGIVKFANLADYTTEASPAAGDFLTIVAAEGDTRKVNWSSLPTAGTPTVITVADTTDATSFVGLFESATGDLAPKTDGGLLYDASNGTLSSTIFNTPTLTLTGTGTLNGLDAIDATGETTLETALDLAGDVSATGLGNTVIGNDKILESMLKAVDAAADEECLTKEDTIGDFEWQACGAGGVPTAITVADESSDSTTFLSFFTDATGDLGPKTNSALTFNTASGALSTGRLIVTSSNFTVGASIPFSDTAGTLTLQNIDVLDATTEATFESTLDIAGDVTGTGLGSVVVAANAVALSTDTTGNYVSSATASGGLVLTGTEGGSLGVLLPAATNALSSTTSTGSGLELLSGGLTLLQGCSDNQVLKWVESTDTWDCSTPSGSGTVTATGGSLTSNAVVLGAGTTDTKVSTGITTNGTAQLVLGVNTSTIGTIKMFGNTSGDVTISPTAVAGTATAWTIPATSDTFVGKTTTDSFTNKTIPASSNVLDACVPVAVTDEYSNLTAGTAKVTFRMPFAMTVTSVRASLVTVATGGTLVTVDINEAGTTILSTKLTFDASELTTTTAATAAVVSDSSLADDALMTVDIDAVGSTLPGNGLKIAICGTI